MLSARKNDGGDGAWRSQKPMRQSRLASMGIIGAIVLCLMLASIKFAEKLLVQPAIMPLAFPIEIEQEIFIKPKKIEKILAEESLHIIYEAPPPPPEVKPEPKPKPPPPPPPPKPRPKPKVKPKVVPKATPAPTVAGVAGVADNGAELAAQKMQAEKMALGLLVGLVEKYKKYPRQAMKKGIQGAITLHVVLNNQGIVTSATVVGSGPTVLRKATEQLAGKLIGQSVGVNTALNVRVPISYKLK